MVTVTMPIEEYNLLLKTQQDANDLVKINHLLLTAIDRMTIGGLEAGNAFLETQRFRLERDEMARIKLNKIK